MKKIIIAALFAFATFSQVYASEPLKVFDTPIQQIGISLLVEEGISHTEKDINFSTGKEEVLYVYYSVWCVNYNVYLKSFKSFSDNEIIKNSPLIQDMTILPVYGCPQIKRAKESSSVFEFLTRKY